MDDKEPNEILELKQKNIELEENNNLLIKENKNLSVEAEKSKQEIIEYYENIIAILPGHIYWKDKKGTILGCNNLQAYSSGCTDRKELIGRGYDLVEPNQADAIRKIDEEVMLTGKSFTVEEIATFANGESKTFLSTKVPHYHQNEVIGIIGVSVDITDRKQMAEREKKAFAFAAQEKARAEAANELRKGIHVYAGGIGHNFKTQLISSFNYIKTLIEYMPKLLSLCDEHKLKNLKKEIGERPFNQLINSGKELFSINKGIEQHIEISLHNLNNVGNDNKDKFVICNIWDIIHESTKLFKTTEQINDDDLIWDKQGFEFLGNAIEANIIICNLFSNAIYQIKQNKKGKIFITTELNDKENIIYFKDTAGGAAEEIVKTIFDGYNSTKGEKGTGVGLSSCKKIMNKFGGDITCYSVFGDYIEFKLIFPKI